MGVAPQPPPPTPFHQPHQQRADKVEKHIPGGDAHMSLSLELIPTLWPRGAFTHHPASASDCHPPKKPPTSQDTPAPQPLSAQSHSYHFTCSTSPPQSKALVLGALESSWWKRHVTPCVHAVGLVSPWGPAGAPTSPWVEQPPETTEWTLLREHCKYGQVVLGEAMESP